MKRLRGADVVVKTLESVGVRHLFTLSGNQVMSIFDAALDTGIQLIHVRHEGAAVHMADAWARLTGQVGVALVAAGPGHANALSALYTALAADSPLVLLSGHAPLGRSNRGAFQELAQVELARPVVKAAWRADDATHLGVDIADAIRIATSGRPGPVHVSLPSDVLEALADQASILLPDPWSYSSPRMELDAGSASTILEALGKASRPIVLTGPKFCTPLGQKVANSLEQVLKVPVVGMESPRGVNDPSLGRFARMLSQADCILLLGKRIDYTVGFARAPVIDPGCKVIAIYPEDDTCRKTSAGSQHASNPSQNFVADPFAAAQSLASIASKGAWTNSEWFASVRKAIAFRLGPADREYVSHTKPMHPLQLCRVVQSVFGDDPGAILVSDGGEFCQWAQAGLSLPRRIINGPAGAIGGALPFAIAARLAEPQAPIVAMTGDGALGFHLAEFDTAVRYGLPIVVIVGNDSRWNAEYQLQLKKYGTSRLAGCELLPTRYDKIAEAFGGYGEQVNHLDELEGALKRALSSKQPACVNVSITGVPAPHA